MIVVAASVAAGSYAVMSAPHLFPEAFAAAPQSHLLDTANDVFPLPFDTKRLRKFDITFDKSFSAEAERIDTVKKIGFGHKETVTIVTTPSGVYSSDAITSPNVRYPGIDVAPKEGEGRSFSFRTWTSPRGTGTWTRFGSGSFVYYTYTFKPAART